MWPRQIARSDRYCTFLLSKLIRILGLYAQLSFSYHGSHYLSCTLQVLLGFSIMVASSPWVGLLGMAAGHAYYFLEDVYPVMTGRRILKTPGIIKALFPEDVVVVPTRPANGWVPPAVVPEPQLPHRD
jgi:hypothetical protein